MVEQSLYPRINCSEESAIEKIDLQGAGFESYVVVDVSGSDTPLNEMAAMLRMTQAGAVMVSWASVASEIMKDWDTPEGPAVGQFYQEFSYWGNRL